MRRRTFIAALGSAAMLPLASHAQQAIPKIGFLRSSTEFNAAYLANSLRTGLKEAGLLEGQHYTIEARYANNSAERLPALAAELARLPAAVIVADNSSALAVKRTAAVPLVFASGGDPIANGLVASLNRPGGNVTGVVFLTGVLGAKRFDLLHRLVPNAVNTAAFVHPGTPTTEAERRELQSAAQETHQRIIIYEINSQRRYCIGLCIVRIQRNRCAADRVGPVVEFPWTGHRRAGRPPPHAGDVPTA